MFHCPVLHDVLVQAEVFAEQVPGGSQHGCLWCSFPISKRDTANMLPEKNTGFASIGSEGGHQIFSLCPNFGPKAILNYDFLVDPAQLTLFFFFSKTLKAAYKIPPQKP